MSSPPLVRLSGIPLSRLPPPDASPDVLTPFIHDILREALPFLISASSSPSGPDRKLWKHKGDKTSPDSTAKVEAWERTVHVEGGKAGASSGEEAGSGGGGGAKKEKETWALRRSVHEDRAEKGTASWAEFEVCFRHQHAEAEKAFTPNVQGTHEALVWDCSGVPAFFEGGGGDDKGTTIAWANFGLKVEEMRHKIGRPVLKDRTFPVLQLTAGAVATATATTTTTTGVGGENHQPQQDFIVVSIPVPDFGSSENSKLAKESGAQVALYVSVERIRKLAASSSPPQHDGGNNNGGSIEWIMATASDAGGVLPQFVQNVAMPGVVWKDVPLFLGWIAKERQGGRDVANDGVTGDNSRKKTNGK
ncbi:hypothetical protein PFICI_01426 [Pestalotiopsis fici W106-1]|uniref:DUF3074 domain-containing protein n=1 Tax=Pestalotiopsis fici (strain W106-1 / CGMCC3.15140) TaxID=1229662 RepID=W3XNG5_PESFW|nr:uncharacterized protein PFICI_01426 [Pestalotiopsis fici W106-1]ETS87598.1 hypothetical protein PFICI_01426 [Pestalotiopsis fici W106-1]